MAIVMSMHWPEVTVDQYEQVRREVKWETEVPEGAKFHVAWFGDDGFHVVDLWDAPEQFQSFAQERLMPVVQKVGISTQPTVAISNAHAVFAPNV